MALPPSPKARQDHIQSPRWQNQIFATVLKVLFASLVAFFLSQLRLDFIEAFLYDQKIRLKPVSKTSGHIELVLVDSKTIQTLRGQPSADEFISVIENISQQRPRYIVVAIDPKTFEGSAQQIHALATAMARYRNLYIVTDQMEQKGEEGSLKLEAPFTSVNVASAPKTSDKRIFAEDNVTRRMLSSYQGQNLFHTRVAASYNPEILSPEKIRGTFDFLGSQQLYIDFHPTGFYPRQSFSDLLNLNSKSSASSDPSLDLKDKIVILGLDNQRSSSDYITTPFSRELLAMNIAEMHANMFDTLIQNSAPRLPPRTMNALIIFVISFFTIWVVLSLKPLKGLFILFGSAVGLTLISFIAQWPFNIWLPTATPLISIFLVYYFFIPYRLIRENRRSWEYYQKHQLLQQVEELKTNFISMMSHDLKTPLARIKGMTDVIQSDANHLSSMQIEALDTIKSSSDDLLKFINAILAYGMIEREGVELHFQSRDINELLNEVIRKHEFHAKLKKIQIVVELETLFPISVDPELMKQVLSNLIENAIKYSPEETKILISTEEQEGLVIIQVADQGQGIAEDEIENIFDKFFRSKNAKSSPIKGSGLGLYLAKYFTELHQGRIYVESSLGQGSTFTVELPLDFKDTHGG